MFSNMLEYMKSQNIKDFYLYTDTSCNYGFYEHQGMIKRKEKNSRIMFDKSTKRIFKYRFTSWILNNNRVIIDNSIQLKLYQKGEKNRLC